MSLASDNVSSVAQHTDTHVYVYLCASVYICAKEYVLIYIHLHTGNRV